MAGATVKVNGKELADKTNSAGSATSSELYVIGSKIEVEASLAGYYPLTKKDITLTDKDGQDYVVNMELEKLPGNIPSYGVNWKL